MTFAWADGFYRATFLEYFLSFTNCCFSGIEFAAFFFLRIMCAITTERMNITHHAGTMHPWQLTAGHQNFPTPWVSEFGNEPKFRKTIPSLGSNTAVSFRECLEKFHLCKNNQQLVEPIAHGEVELRWSFGFQQLFASTSPTSDRSKPATKKCERSGFFLPPHKKNPMILCCLVGFGEICIPPGRFFFAGICARVLRISENQTKSCKGTNTHTHKMPKSYVDFNSPLTYHVNAKMPWNLTHLCVMPPHLRCKMSSQSLVIHPYWRHGNVFSKCHREGVKIIWRGGVC